MAPTSKSSTSEREGRREESEKGRKGETANVNAKERARQRALQFIVSKRGKKDREEEEEQEGEEGPFS